MRAGGSPATPHRGVLGSISDYTLTVEAVKCACLGLGHLCDSSNFAPQVALSTLVGSALETRSAGNRQASVATAERVATAAAIVVTSYGVTPKMSDRMTSTLLSASSTPTASPAAAMAMPSPTTLATN